MALRPVLYELRQIVDLLQLIIRTAENINSLSRIIKSFYLYLLVEEALRGGLIEPTDSVGEREEGGGRGRLPVCHPCQQLEG